MQITIDEVIKAMHRLIRLGMTQERAVAIVAQAYPEYRSALHWSVLH